MSHRLNKLNTQMIEMIMAEVLNEPHRLDIWEVSDWVKYGSVPPQFSHLPNAIAAQEIMNSPLHSALSEEK